MPSYIEGRKGMHVIVQKYVAVTSVRSSCPMAQQVNSKGYTHWKQVFKQLFAHNKCHVNVSIVVKMYKNRSH